MSFKFLTPAVRLWPLLLVALLALICITGPTPAEAACKSKRHTSSSRSLLDNNSTTRTTRHATQHSSSRAGGDRGCGTKSPSAEVKNLIRQKLAQADKAKKRRVAATGGGAVGIASTPSSGLQPPAAATIYLVFHIISDVGIAVPGGTLPNTAWHRDPSNPSVGSSAKAGLPTCAHMTDATIANQVTKLNQAFSGALTFVTQNVYRYEVTDNIPLGACQNPSCYVPGTPILIDYQGWWDTTNNGHNHAPIYGDPNDDVTLQNALEGNLVIKGNSGSLINVFMWDWDAVEIEDVGTASFYDNFFFTETSWQRGEDWVIVHCETAPGGSGAKIDLDPGNKNDNDNKPWYSSAKGPEYNGGELIHQMGHAFGLFHVNEGPCDFPFGGDEVDDTPSEDSRRDNVFGGNDYDPPTWCPPEGVIDTCLWAGVDLINNFMHSAERYDDTCRNSFTPGQLRRARGVWEVFRKPPGCTTAPTPLAANAKGSWPASCAATALSPAIAGSTCFAQCDPGYVPDPAGALLTRCDPAGTGAWLAPAGSCILPPPGSCGGLPGPAANAYNWFGQGCVPGAAANSVCTATCLPTATGGGYTLTCLNGNWVQSGSGCTASSGGGGGGPATCGGLPGPPPGASNWFGPSCFGNAPVGSSCQATCQSPATGQGYLLSCGATGWVQSGAGCTTIQTCGDFPNPPLGASNWGGVGCFSPAPNGVTCSASCLAGSSAGNGYTIVCLQGSWILQSGSSGCGESGGGSAASCSSNPTSSRPANTQDWVGCAGVLVGSTCTASCLPGAVGGYTARCTAKNTWDTSGNCILTGVANIAVASAQLTVRYSGACIDTATGALINSLMESINNVMPRDRTQFSLEVTAGNCTAVVGKRSGTQGATPAATESNQPMAIKVTEALGNALSTSGQAIQALQDWYNSVLATGWCASNSAVLNACINVIRTTGGQEINAPATGQQMSPPGIATNPPTICLAGQQLTSGSCNWCPAGSHNPIPGAYCVKCSVINSIPNAGRTACDQCKPGFQPSFSALTGALSACIKQPTTCSSIDNAAVSPLGIDCVCSRGFVEVYAAQGQLGSCRNLGCSALPGQQLNVPGTGCTCSPGWSASATAATTCVISCANVPNSKPNATATGCTCIGSFKPTFNNNGILQSCDLPANDQAVPDSVTAVSGKRTRIKPLANDFGQGLKIGAVTAPTKGGRVTLASDGVTLIYLSAPGFIGIDTFTYTTRNSSQAATVTVNVTVGSCDSNSCTMGVCNVTTGTCDCKSWLGMLPTFVINGDPVQRRIIPRVPACRYPVFAPDNFNTSVLMESPVGADLSLTFAVSRNSQRCLQAVLVAIGFIPVSAPVNATNTQTTLAKACLAGAAADKSAFGVSTASQGSSPADVLDANSGESVITQTVEIKAIYQETCVSGKYSVKVQAPEDAGCYYFALHLADGSRQIMVLRATAAGGAGN